MTTNASPGEIAERAQRRRNRMLWLAPMLFFIWQGAFFSSYATPHAPLRTVELVSLGSHLFLGLVLLLLLATGGGWRYGKTVRALLDDESTRAHRAQAYGAGFWALALCVLALYAAAPFVRMEAGDIAHILLSVAVAVPALRFVMLERRADRE
jgi:cytochrome b561